MAGEGSGMFYFHWIMFITSAAELGRPSGERALYEIDLLQDLDGGSLALYHAEHDVKHCYQ